MSHHFSLRFTKDGPVVLDRLEVGFLWRDGLWWRAEYRDKRRRFQYRGDARRWITQQAQDEPIYMPGLVVQLLREAPPSQPSEESPDDPYLMGHSQPDPQPYEHGDGE